MEQVTILGDSGVVLPLVLAYGVLLHRRHSPHLASHWLRAIFLCVVIVGTVKIAAFSANQYLKMPRIGNISGHTALAGTVYLCAALAWSRSFGQKIATILALAILVMVGLSRIVLGAHDVAEVVMGGIVGILLAVSFAWQRWAPCPWRHVWWSIAVTMTLGRTAMFALRVTPDEVARLMGNAVAVFLGNNA